MEEIASAIFEALTKSPLNATASLIIFLLAMPLIIKGLRDRKEEPPTAPVPVQVESPWLVIELNLISTTLQEMHRDIRDLAKVLDRVSFRLESRK